MNVLRVSFVGTHRGLRRDGALEAGQLNLTHARLIADALDALLTGNRPRWLQAARLASGNFLTQPGG